MLLHALKIILTRIHKIVRHFGTVLCNLKYMKGYGTTDK